MSNAKREKEESVLKRLQAYMGRRKVLMPLAMAVSGVSALLLLLPFVLVWLIVGTILHAQGIPADTPIYTYAWWAVGSAVVGVGLYFGSSMLAHLAAFSVEVNMRRRAMGRLMTLPLGFFDRQSSGRLRKIIDENASETHTFVAHILPDLAGSIVSFVVITVLIFAFNWQLGLACLVPLLVAFASMGFLRTARQQEFQRKYLDAQERMGSEAVEYVRGIPVVKVFQQSVFSFERFYNSITEYRDLVSQYSLGMQVPMSVYTTVVHSFAFFLVPVAILMIGRWGDYVGIISDLLLYMLIAPVIISSVLKLMYTQHNLFLAKEAISRVERLTEGVSPLVAGGRTMLPGHSIAFEGVSFAYPGTERNAVDGVSFTIPEGQTYALVGASGGGKTSIARLIPRFWDADTGKVSIGGVDVRDIAPETLMARIAFVFQNTQLFKMSLRENILYGNPEASEEALQRAITLSQSREIIERLPHGLETKIGAEGTYLSGGEQQRIVLARAFLKDAPIVVLDEATAFADPENEHLIQTALHTLMQGKTSLMIAHRLPSVRHADCVLVVADGRIAEQGRHDELIALGGLYSNMWEEYQKAAAWAI